MLSIKAKLSALIDEAERLHEEVCHERAVTASDWAVPKAINEAKELLLSLEDRVNVYQEGEVVGSLPTPTCDITGFVTFIQAEPTNPLVESRRYDFTTKIITEGNGWRSKTVLVASPTLARGDLLSLEGFIPNQKEYTND